MNKESAAVSEKEKVDDIKQLFAELPTDIKSREYEQSITKIANKLFTKETDPDETIDIDAMKSIMNSKSPDAFTAFYCLSVYYRRNNNYNILKEMIDANEKRFKDNPSFNHIKTEYYIHSGEYYDFNSLLESAYQDAITFRKNPGFSHTFVNAFVTKCESLDDEEDFNELMETWYERAYTLINQAIEMQEYPKFFCTKGRLLALNGSFDPAITHINKAIGTENPSRNDYFMTISNYQDYKMEVKLRQQKFDYERRIAELEKMMIKKSDANLISSEQKIVSPPEPCDCIKPYVFVSYAHDNSNIVYPIIKKLTDKGYEIWYDQGLPDYTGEKWKDVLTKKIKRCSVFMVMLSSKTNNSDDVGIEISIAKDKKKPIIPVYLEDISLPKVQEYTLKDIEYLRMYDYNEQTFIKKLGALITKRLELGNGNY